MIEFKNAMDYIIPMFAFGALSWAFAQLIYDWPPRKAKRNLRKMKEHAGQILRWVVEGHSTGRELQLSEILMMGVNPGFKHMGAVYFALIQALDLSTKVKIIDKIVEHGSNRCFGNQVAPDLAQCLGALNNTEAETVVMCITTLDPSIDYVDKHQLKYDTNKFANAVIAFRLANP